MKKLLGILVLGLILTGTSYAADEGKKAKDFLKSISKKSLTKKESKKFVLNYAITLKDERKDGIVTYIFDEENYERYKDFKAITKDAWRFSKLGALRLFNNDIKMTWKIKLGEVNEINIKTKFDPIGKLYEFTYQPKHEFLASVKKYEENKIAKKELEKQKEIAKQKKIEEEKKRVEEERLAAEQKLEEEKKRLEEERLAAEQKLAEEKKRLEEERLAAEQKLEEEKKRLEEERLAAEQKLAEEKKRLEEERLEFEREKEELEEQKKAEEEKKELEEQKKAEGGEKELEEQKKAEEKKKRLEEKKLAAQKKAEERKKKLEEKKLAAQKKSEERKKKLEEKKLATNIYDNAEDYFPRAITEKKMQKDLSKEITFKKLTINRISARDKFNNKMNLVDVADNFEKNGKYLYISQIAKDDKRNIHCLLEKDDAIKWLSWMNKKDERLLTTYTTADLTDWLIRTGTEKKENSMRFKTEIPLLKGKSWPEVYIKGTVSSYFLDAGLYLIPCQFKEIELKAEKKSTKKKAKKEKTKEASNISNIELSVQKNLMQKKLVYKNNDGETCSLTFYKSGYLEISSNCSPLTKEYNYFNNYLFYKAGTQKVYMEAADGEVEFVVFKWFTLKDKEFFLNWFSVLPNFNPDGSPKFFVLQEWGSEGLYQGTLHGDIEMEAHEIDDISCDASTYTELAKCSLPQILEFCEVKDFEPFDNSYHTGGIGGTKRSLFTYLFEREVIGKDSFASIPLKKCINKINPIFSETPKSLYFSFYFPGSAPIIGKNSQSGDVGKDWQKDKKLIGTEFIVADFGTTGFKGADVKDPKFTESIVRELNRKYDINLAELPLIHNFMTTKQLLLCNIQTFDKTVSCPNNYPDGFITYYDNYKINLEIYYGMTIGGPDNDLITAPQARMIFTDKGDVVREMAQRRIKVLQGLGGL